MVRFLRSTAACFVVLLITIRAAGQDLTPALADQLSRGIADLKAGKLDAAETSFRGILRDGGEVAPVHHNLASVLQQRGRHEQALVDFDAASRIDRTPA